MAINIFGAPPDYLSGLLGVDPEKLRKQATTTGLINTALAFAAQPRNQNYGSVLPYAARALMAGQQGAQGVYQGAMQDAQAKQQIEELKRKQEQQQRLQQMIGGIQDPTQRLAAELAPTEYAKSVLQPAAKRETFVAPDGSIRFKDTGEIAQQDIVRAPKERETMMAPNGMLIYKDTGEPVTQRSFAAPKEPKEVKMYSDTPIATPSGYVYMPTAEGIRSGLQPYPIQGAETPDQLKQMETQKKTELAKESALETANLVKGAVSDAKNILDKPFSATSGLTGALASKLARPDRVALEGYLDTIKANLSFETLSSMKAASPTGGALGSVSENELRLLGSTVASLDPRLPASVLKKNLEQVNRRYEKIKRAIEQDFGGKVDLMPQGELMPSRKATGKKKLFEQADAIIGGGK
jgi:hypothetical protein